MERKVHYAKTPTDYWYDIPVCHANFLDNKIITTRNRDRVTCKRCQKILLAELNAKYK